MTLLQRGISPVSLGVVRARRLDPRFKFWDHSFGREHGDLKLAICCAGLVPNSRRTDVLKTRHLHRYERPLACPLLPLLRQRSRQRQLVAHQSNARSESQRRTLVNCAISKAILRGGREVHAIGLRRARLKALLRRSAPIPGLEASEHQPKTSLAVFIEAKLQPCRSELAGEEHCDGRALVRAPTLGALIEPACLVPERQTRVR